MENKDFTSNVESIREHFEEPIQTAGNVIKSTQIWRDANLIPEIAPSYIGLLVQQQDKFGNTYKSGKLLTFNDGAKVNDLISYYDYLPLYRVSGTLNCYSNEELKNIILEDSGHTYIPKIYVNDNKLAYEVGKPYFDVAAGTLLFLDLNFATEYKDANIRISFYKYIGRIGTSVSDKYTNAELPFRDDIKHFKDAEHEERTATFKVRGDLEHTDYILPPAKEKWYDKGNATGGVVLLQETLEDTLWEQNTQISGGRWIDKNGIVEVDR